MKTLRDKVTEMFLAQHKLNCNLHPEWWKQGWNFRLAIQMEAAEAIEHLGWKWWKHQDSNLKQAQMELVDIVHFLMSELMTQVGGTPTEDDIEEFTTLVLRRVQSVEANLSAAEAKGDLETLLRLLEPTQHLRLLLLASVLETQVLVEAFTRACYALDMPLETIYSWYLGKKTLNRFRWEHGYDDGSYRKIWHDGCEDNVHLERILDSVSDDVTEQEIYDALESGYAKAGV